MASNQESDNNSNNRRQQQRDPRRNQHHHYYHSAASYEQSAHHQQQQSHRYSNSRHFSNNNNPKIQNNKKDEIQQQLQTQISKLSSVSNADTDDPTTPTCVCCLHELRTHVTYSCLHYVCLHCALKMRILCEKFDCPICRQISADVICTKEALKNTVTDFNEELKNYLKKAQLKGGFYYSLDMIKVEYEQILSSYCKLCDTRPDFNNFDELEAHYKRVHKRFFCELCLTNLKLFSFERKFYTREELAQHRREGDQNDQSFKGHPACNFCDERFFDRDDLYRHYRKEHMYCHFCDADGYEEYYKNYEQLRTHFLKYHFLCELEECAWSAQRESTHEYSVFRTELDYQAHKKQKHAKSKSEAKSMGRLNIEFNVKNPIRDRIKTQQRRQQHSQESVENAVSQPKLRDFYEDYEIVAPKTSTIETEPQPEPIQKTQDTVHISGEHVAVHETNQPSTWRNVISNGPTPRVNLEAEFPSLNTGDSVMYSSLSTLGESISKSGSSVWSAKKPQTPKKVAPKPDLTEQKAQKNVVKDVSSNMVSLKTYLKEADKPVVAESPPVVTVIKDEEKKDKKDKKVKKKKKKDEQIESVVKNVPEPRIETVPKAEFILTQPKTPPQQQKRVSQPPPPPGFASKIDTKIIDNETSSLILNTPSKPPPGFQKPPSPPPEPQPQPQSAVPDESYIKPFNYEIRNNELTEKLQTLFQSNFDKFKQYSIEYRIQTIYNPKLYFDKCLHLIAHDGQLKQFFQLMQEMIVLLPNIKKQNELYDIYLIEYNSSSLNKKTSSWVTTSTASNAEKDETLLQCMYCDQLMFKNELNSHLNYHRDGAVSNGLVVNEEFPPLGFVTNKNTFSDLPSAIFNNPNESLSLVNKKKNRFSKYK